jgi:hypothetical protein
MGMGPPGTSCGALKHSKRLRRAPAIGSKHSGRRTAPSTLAPGDKIRAGVDVFNVNSRTGDEHEEATGQRDRSCVGRRCAGYRPGRGRQGPSGAPPSPPLQALEARLRGRAPRLREARGPTLQPLLSKVAGHRQPVLAIQVLRLPLLVVVEAAPAILGRVTDGIRPRLTPLTARP